GVVLIGSCATEAVEEAILCGNGGTRNRLGVGGDRAPTACTWRQDAAGGRIVLQQQLVAIPPIVDASGPDIGRGHGGNRRQSQGGAERRIGYDLPGGAVP